jgi:3-oxoacyl-[acyl-carrier protein] reductase
MDAFDAIEVGRTEEFLHTITDEEISSFCELTGDNNPLHMDNEFAKKTNFKGRVVHGMLTASFISTMIGTRLPGKGALWYEQHLKFLEPVRVGDTIKIYAKVIHKSETQRIIVLETIIFNSAGGKVIDGEAKVKVLENPEVNTRRKAAVNNLQKKPLRGAVIVTGGSGGIGSATAKLLASEGFGMIVNYSHSKDKADEACQEIEDAGGRAYSFKADVASRLEVDALTRFSLEKFGSIDGVVNNASGGITNTSFNNMTWDDIQLHLDVQIKGCFNVCQSVMPHLLNMQRGCIVNIASIYADNVPPPQLLHYSLAKAALLSFTRSLAVEYGPKGIRVNAVSPGMTLTGLLKSVPERAKMVAKMQTALRKLAQPEDVASVVNFFFSDGAGHMTGENIRVCGGQVML